MLATNYGFFNTSGSRTHVRFQFSTHEAAGGNVAPNSAFEAADLRIYKAADGAAFSATQRSSANGITMTSPFDSLTGVHDVDIDLADNTDAGFYAAGCAYTVMLSPDETVDGQTLTGVVLAYFEIGRAQVDVREIGGDAQSGTDLKDFADAGYDPATNKVEGVKLADTLTTYTGNTPQTGDAFARIGANGAGLSALPWNAAWDAEVQSEAADALNAYDPPTRAEATSDKAEIIADTDDIQSRLPAALVAGRMASNAEVVGDKTGYRLSATGVDDVWDEALAGHAGAGTTGAALIAAGSAGDPWSTPLPGAYGAGTAGQIIGDFLDAAISDVKSQTDLLPSDPADQSLIIAATNAIMARLGAPVGADLSADLAAIKGDTVDIEAKVDIIDGIVDSITARIPAALASGRMVSVAQVVDDKTGYALTVAERAAVADKLLGRTRAGGADGGRTVAQCLAISRNRWRINAGALEVYDDNDTDILWSGVASSAPSDPVHEVDPT